MRRQERRWAEGKRESREEHLNRLRSTATRPPTRFVEWVIGGMRRRCQLFHEANGHNAEEGGAERAMRKCSPPL